MVPPKVPAFGTDQDILPVEVLTTYVLGTCATKLPELATPSHKKHLTALGKVTGKEKFGPV